MIEIKTDNKDAKKCIETILKKVETCGGILNAPMAISCIDGYLSILTPRDTHKGPLIILPPEAMPPVKKFKINVKGNDLYVDSHADDIDEFRLELMKLMMELYNITGKIKDYRQTSPWIFLNRHPGLSAHISIGRNGPSIKKYLNNKDFDQDQEIITTFIKSRQLAFKPAPHNNEAIQVIMPVIDFLNHHALSPSFYGQPDDGEKMQLAVKVSHPVMDTDETFVSYGPYDALDTIVNYSYPDNTASFTRSVCINLALENVGTLVINSFSGARPTTPPPHHMADLKFFMPRFLAQEDDCLEISHLYIPGPGAPRALRRMLGYLISRLAPDLPQSKLSSLVLQAEDTVIQENLSYYEELQHKIESLPANEKDHVVASMLKQTAQIQTEKIHKYDRVRKRLVA